MALIFCDGFDHYATADIYSKWSIQSSGVIGGYGRFGTNGWYANGGWMGGLRTPLSWSTQGTIGFAFMPNNDWHMCSLMSGTTNQVGLYYLSSTNQIQLTLNAPVNTRNSPMNPLRPGSPIEESMMIMKIVA